MTFVHFRAITRRVKKNHEDVVLNQQRKQHLLGLLKADGRIVATETANALGVSEDTIRRDLRELAAEGLLLRVHGGALPASRAVENLASRRTISMPEKKALARAAAGLIKPDQVVFLDGGTTTLELVGHIDRDLRLLVVTHSPTIAAELVDHRAEVQLIGGRLFKHSMVSVGAAAAEAIRQIRADVYFMGVTGIHAEYGLSTGDAEEAVIKRTIAGCAAEVVVMASTEKIGAASPFLIAPAASVTHLLVPETTPPQALKPFRKLGLEVTCVALNGRM
jgi:DeoR/GlpR family transcriptional regulator of sugar metabolism